MHRGGRVVRPRTENKDINSGLGDREEEEHEAGATGVAPGTEGEDTHKPTLKNLTDILQAFMGKQEARDLQLQEEAKQQEHRLKALQHQFQLLQMEVQASTSPIPELTSSAPDPPDVSNFDNQPSQPTSAPECEPSAPSRPQFSIEPRLEKLTENDDVEHFLVTFERIATACKWSRSDWVFHLIPLLTGKARSAYVAMDFDESQDYEKVKTAILHKYDINTESYRQRFRSLEVGPEETPKELYARLKELYDKWIQPKGKTTKEIAEIIIMEQYLRMVSPELQIWIKEHGPNSAAEVASLAEVFVAARKKSLPWSNVAWQASKDSRRSANHQYHQRSAPGTNRTPLGEEKQTRPAKPSSKTPICYLCGQEGHIKPLCPKHPVKLTQMCLVPYQSLPPETQEGESMTLTTVRINGKSHKALVDTGSTQTLVQRQHVPANIICTRETISICCVHGDRKIYPTAELYIEVQGQTYFLNVGVVDDLPFPVVLGHDLPVLFDLLDTKGNSNFAVTRTQTRLEEEQSPLLSALPFDDAELETNPGKSRKPRSQRRQEKFKHTTEANN
uniref:Uncharacterized protein n=1 Tax=Oryzias sinensis TaxID=183150 RepID=A0A8C7Y906_9TELE